MKTLRDLSILAVLWALTAFLVTLGIYTPRVAKDVQVTLETYRTAGRQIGQTAEDGSRVLYSANETLLATRDTAQTFRIAAQKNQQYYDQIARQAAGSEKALRLFLDRTDRQLNDHVFPDLDATIVGFNNNSTQAMWAITQAGNSMTLRINDPQITEFVKNMNVASLQFAGTMTHVDGSAAAVEHTFRYYDKKLTTPVSFARQVTDTVIDYGAKFGSMFAGFAH